jgi:hypothetical protein
MRMFLAAAAVLVSLLAIGTAQARDAADKPRIRVLDLAPLTLRGVDFDASEQIRLVVRLGDRTVIRKLLATSTGSFTSRYPTMRYNRCNGSLEVTASGRKGSRVSWELIPLECPTTVDD